MPEKDAGLIHVLVLLCSPLPSPLFTAEELAQHPLLSLLWHFALGWKPLGFLGEKNKEVCIKGLANILGQASVPGAQNKTKKQKPKNKQTKQQQQNKNKTKPNKGRTTWVNRSFEHILETGSLVI